MVWQLDVGENCGFRFSRNSKQPQQFPKFCALKAAGAIVPQRWLDVFSPAYRTGGCNNAGGSSASVDTGSKCGTNWITSSIDPTWV